MNVFDFLWRVQRLQKWAFKMKFHTQQDINIFHNENLWNTFTFLGGIWNLIFIMNQIILFEEIILFTQFLKHQMQCQGHENEISSIWYIVRASFCKVRFPLEKRNLTELYHLEGGVILVQRVVESAFWLKLLINDNVYCRKTSYKKVRYQLSALRCGHSKVKWGSNKSKML